MIDFALKLGDTPLTRKKATAKSLKGKKPAKVAKKVAKKAVKKTVKASPRKSNV